MLAPTAAAPSRGCQPFHAAGSGARSRPVRNALVVRATAAPVEKEKPDWTGESLLSRAVNAAIGNQTIFGVMKAGARQVMKNTGAKRGVPWDENVRALEQSEVFQIKEEIEDPSVVYPAYYTVPFHGYDQGNLNWQAAFEVEPAGDVIALRSIVKNEGVTPVDAQIRLRKGIFDHMHEYIAKHNIVRNPTQLLDIGCSVGVSTRYLAAEFPNAAVTGLDLSPYFLAVAELRERQLGGGAGQRQRITYLHRDMEHTGLPDASCDVVSVQFVTHECPAHIICSLVRECRRLVKPGGLVLFADNNPRSKTIQNLPPVLFTLMKSTEPWTDEYYAFNLEACMREAGLQDVVTEEADHRHRVVFGHT